MKQKKSKDSTIQSNLPNPNPEGQPGTEKNVSPGTDEVPDEIMDKVVEVINKSNRERHNPMRHII